MANENKGLTLWHGAQRWSGLPEVKPHAQGQYECGPGINMTTRWLTARKHSRGGGQLMEMTLTPDLVAPDRWLESAKLPVNDMHHFVNSVPRLKNRLAILADIGACADRMGSEVIGANVLVNLIVNHEAGAGQAGVALAHFLSSKGIQASLHRPGGDEDWVIVFDPKAIIKVHQVTAKELNERDPNELDRDPVILQLAHLRRTHQVDAPVSPPSPQPSTRRMSAGR